MRKDFFIFCVNKLWGICGRAQDPPLQCLQYVFVCIYLRNGEGAVPYSVCNRFCTIIIFIYNYVDFFAKVLDFLPIL